jgi:uridine kinase
MGMKALDIEQVISVGVAFFGSIFGLVKYLSAQNKKREDSLLRHNEIMQKQQLEYFEQKNHHIERMQEQFIKANKEIAERNSESNDRNTKAIQALTTEIKVLAAKRK